MRRMYILKVSTAIEPGLSFVLGHVQKTQGLLPFHKTNKSIHQLAMDSLL